MRFSRLLGALLSVLTVALLAAPGAAAEPPMRLATHVSDYTSALNDSQRATVRSAVAKLYADRHIRLWVVYVANFSNRTGDSWSRATASRSDLGDYDALLAVALDDRAYGFLVSPAIADAGQVDALRRDSLEPTLARGDWAGAALAAVNGLRGMRPPGPAPMNWTALLLGLGAVGLAGAVLAVGLGYRRRRRRAAVLAAVRRVDPTDADALTGLPLYALDELSQLLVVDVDNALRTSANELALAVDEFGDDHTRPFTKAVENAKAALTQAFTVRQRLDDAVTETAGQRRELISAVIVDAAEADRELEAQREAFEELRGLVVNAPFRLNELTQRLVGLTARIPAAEQQLHQLHREFDAAALAPVRDNVGAARDRLAFAERNITRARELAAHPVTGGQGGLVDAVRAAESALAQARTLLDAVGSAGDDIRHAAAVLPETVAAEQATAQRLATAVERAVAAAAARVRAVSDYIDTRRGSIGPAARTRLAEARRQLGQARAARSRDAATALEFANSAAALADSAQSLAQADAVAAHRAHYSRDGGPGSGDDTGAMLGGIIVGNLLGGALRGGWSPTSFGGSGSSGPSRPRGPAGGGFLGGGGRF